ncbi:hypothetical protein AAW51_4459 [Caldimonas brevitalea]|uniref:Uncharacterized protein n=1 Tax=Caldimonas brevitalea TaxID=413882 RepID=A0A0G3BX89_9BURK|nr:hypothetical protein AAW51_4459 [Caldimonas brevitalea]
MRQPVVLRQDDHRFILAHALCLEFGVVGMAEEKGGVERAALHPQSQRDRGVGVQDQLHLGTPAGEDLSDTRQHRGAQRLQSADPELAAHRLGMGSHRGFRLAAQVE